MDKTYECEICGIIFEKFQQKANHDRWQHLKKSFSDEGLKNMLDKKIQYEIECYGNYVKEIVNCNKCGKEVEIEYREKLGKKEKYFCSRSCANSKIQTPEINRKRSISVSKSLKEKWANDKEYRDKCTNMDHYKKWFSSYSERELVNYFKETFPTDEWTSGGNIRRNDIQLARDLYSKKLKVNIEVDGIWHFKDIHGQLEEKQAKDKILNEWSKENGWRIIRVYEEFLHPPTKDETYKKIIDFAYNLKEDYIELY